MQRSYENLKTIQFEGELLPKWAQLLDLAARLCPLSESIRDWFSRFTNSSGIDDARTIVIECETLLNAIRQRKDTLIRELQHTREDIQSSQVIAGWEYSLETIIQEARGKKTCSWQMEGDEGTGGGDFGDGDITLRRV
jgi:hypothetical protein